MATLTTSGELDTQLEAFLDDTSQSAQLPVFKSLCEDRLAMDLRLLEMEKAVDLLAYKTYPATAVGGTANDIALTVDSSVTALTKGLTVSWTAASTNSGAMTLTVNGLAQTALKQEDGTVAMAAGDNIAGLDYRAYYDGTVWRLIEPGQVPLPTRFLEAGRIRIGTSKPLEYLSPHNFLDRYLGITTGEPKAYTVEENFIRFGPTPDSNYVAKCLYFRRFASLSSSGDTNWLLTNARGVYLYGTLLEANIYLENDEAAVKFGKLYQDAIDRLTRSDAKKRHGGAPLRTRSSVTAS